MATARWRQLFPGASLQVCFVDEAGDLGGLGDPPLALGRPVLVVAGLFVDVAGRDAITGDFFDPKHRCFPGLPYRSARRPDGIPPEIKGAEPRANATRDSSWQRKHAIGFLDRVPRACGTKTARNDHDPTPTRRPDQFSLGAPRASAVDGSLGWEASPQKI